MVVSWSTKGNFNNTERFFSRMLRRQLFQRLGNLGARGVQALASQTPLDTGRTASAWRYEIEVSSGGYTITWHNDNVQNGFSVAIGLQYGHGTGTGGWVQGFDYINPAIKPIFEEIAEQVWGEVTKA